MTMVDGKVINNLTDTSSQRCFICNCGPKNMNDLKNIQQFKIYDDNLKCGLSTLHAWINFLKCILNISYKLNIHESTSRMSKEEKGKVIQQKKNIQQTFWNDMGIKVDKIVQGQGTSNTGNVARKFLKMQKCRQK